MYQLKLSNLSQDAGRFMSQHEMWTQGAGVFFGANKGKTAPVLTKETLKKIAK